MFDIPSSCSTVAEFAALVCCIAWCIATTREDGFLKKISIIVGVIALIVGIIALIPYVIDLAFTLIGAAIGTGVLFIILVVIGAVIVWLCEKIND